MPPKVIHFQFQLNQLFLLYEDGTMVEAEVEQLYGSNRQEAKVTIVRDLLLPAIKKKNEEKESRKESVL